MGWFFWPQRARRPYLTMILRGSRLGGLIAATLVVLVCAVSCIIFDGIQPLDSVVSEERALLRSSSLVDRVFACAVIAVLSAYLGCLVGALVTVAAGARAGRFHLGAALRGALFGFAAGGAVWGAFCIVSYIIIYAIMPFVHGMPAEWLDHNGADVGTVFLRGLIAGPLSIALVGLYGCVVGAAFFLCRAVLQSLRGNRRRETSPSGGECVGIAGASSVEKDG